MLLAEEISCLFFLAKSSGKILLGRKDRLTSCSGILLVLFLLSSRDSWLADVPFVYCHIAASVMSWFRVSFSAASLDKVLAVFETLLSARLCFADFQNLVSGLEIRL